MYYGTCILVRVLYLMFDKIHKNTYKPKFTVINIDRNKGDGW